MYKSFCTICAGVQHNDFEQECVACITLMTFTCIICSVLNIHLCLAITWRMTFPRTLPLHHRSRSSGNVSRFLRATARSAKRVTTYRNFSVCPSVCLSRPDTDSSPGLIEFPGFHRMIASIFCDRI